MKLRLHLSLCGNRRNVEEQLSGVRAATADLFSGAPDLDVPENNPDLPSRA